MNDQQLRNILTHRTIGSERLQRNAAILLPLVTVDGGMPSSLRCVPNDWRCSRERSASLAAASNPARRRSGRLCGSCGRNWRIPSWQVTLLGPMDKMVHFSGTVYPQVGRVAAEARNALYPNPDEVEEVFTVPLEYFLTQPRKHYTYHMTPDNLQELPEPLAEYVRHYKQTFVTPVWFYEGHTIWGMTARAVEAFLKFFEA